MSDSFSARLREAAASVWEAQHAHPFIRGVGDGSLSLDRFAYWVRQDYLFLIEYARMLALAAARAPNLADMTKLAQLAGETLTGEMRFHRAYAAQFGVSEEALEREPMSPTCRAYTDFLVRVAATGGFVEIVGALLPCMWGFSEIGQRLAERGKPADSRYAEWIEMYASPEFADLAAWCRGLLDRAADGLPDADLDRARDAFLVSSRYEFLFWEMAWNQERWPV